MLFFLLFFFLFAASSFSQKSEIEKARIYTDDGKRISVVDLTMDSVKITYHTEGSSDLRESALTNVLKIEEQSGNEAAVWGLAFGGSALLGSLLGVAEAKASMPPGTTSTAKPVVIVSSITGVSALIGVLIGLGQKKYHTVYTNSGLRSFLNSRMSLQLAGSGNMRMVGIKILF